MTIPSTRTAATLSLLSIAGLSSATRSCEDVTGICLTSFRWCDPSPCEYPEDVWPIHGNLDRNVGYAIIDAGETYNITWTNTAANAEVRVEWSITSGERGNLSSNGDARWHTNTTEGYYLFNPRRIWNQIIESDDFNVTRADLIAMTADLSNFIYVRDLSEPDEELQHGDMTSTFAVQNGWTNRMAEAQKEIGLAQERRKWRLGVGIGVGLGVPIMMAISALVTWFVTKKAARKRESSRAVKESASTAD